LYGDDLHDEFGHPLESLELQALGGADEDHPRVEMRQHACVHRPRVRRGHHAQDDVGLLERGTQVAGDFYLLRQGEPGEIHFIDAAAPHQLPPPERAGNDLLAPALSRARWTIFWERLWPALVS